MSDAPLLDEQLDYYRARAGEYDEWWERRGRYDRGDGANRQWFAEIAEVSGVFDALPLDGDILELAPGTGYWTERLARRARHVTAIDGSPEMLDINKARLGPLAHRVEYRTGDLFAWTPERRWDGLVFCFWISHVPNERLDAFLRTCRDVLIDGATVFFLDGHRAEHSTAIDHTLPAAGDEITLRRLNDGREYRVVKNFYAPERLVDAARRAGFDLQVSSTPTFFQYGSGIAV